MGFIVVYIVIWSILTMISFTLVLVLARRFYMQRKYRLIGLEREKYAWLPAILASGAMTDSGALRKPPGSNAWTAIEEALFKALDSQKAEKGRIRKLFHDLGYTAYYMKKLKTGTRWEQALYAERLGNIECVEAVHELINALASKYRDVRMLAIHSLGEIRDERGLPGLMKALRTAVTSDEEVSIKVLKSALISFGAALMDFIPPLTRDPDWRIRAAAMEILGEIANPATACVFMKGLTDPEQDIRAKSAKALGKLRHRPAIPELKGLLEDPFWVVRIHASRALGLIGDRCVIPDLISLLTDMNWQVRKSAAEALSRIGGDAYAALLDFFLHSEDNYGRAQAAEELESAGIINGLMNFLLKKRDEKACHMAQAAAFGKHDLFVLSEVLRGAGEERTINGLAELAGRMFSDDEIMAAAYSVGRHKLTADTV
ncbi:MAG: HEAT repeat domain-containing protein [Deltaproteobacteria bacterium]|nr:HEAT repeat domain-containing protein [Deltaproteobacteria bacterium]